LTVQIGRLNWADRESRREAEKRQHHEEDAYTDSYGDPTSAARMDHSDLSILVLDNSTISEGGRQGLGSDLRLTES